MNYGISDGISHSVALRMGVPQDDGAHSNGGLRQLCSAQRDMLNTAELSQ